MPGARPFADAQPLVEEVTVRIRKPEVRLGGPLDYAAVQVTRTRR